MKRWFYAGLGLGVLLLAGFMIRGPLTDSLVYFITPSDYFTAPQQYEHQRVRLGGLVEAGSIEFNDQQLRLAFDITDNIESYPIRHEGAPPEMFRENTGVVVEGRFADGVFVSDTLLIKHTEVYEPPKDGEPVDIEALKDALQ